MIAVVKVLRIIKMRKQSAMNAAFFSDCCFFTIYAVVSCIGGQLFSGKLCGFQTSAKKILELIYIYKYYLITLHYPVIS